MDVKQLNEIGIEFQAEIERLEKLEKQRAKERDYADAMACFHHRLGLQSAWTIITKYNIRHNNNRE